MEILVLREAHLKTKETVVIIPSKTKKERKQTVFHSENNIFKLFIGD